MKRILCLVIALVLVFSLSACGPGGRSPAEAYEKYTEMKSNAYGNISGKIAEHNELALSAGMAILPMAMVDLTLIPLTIIGEKGGGMALAFLGMGDIDVKQKGNVYTITYNTSEDETITQICEYDAATDSMKSTITNTEDSLTTLIFEYTKCGNGYVSQYAMKDGQGGDYTLTKMYFNEDGDITIGIETISGSPDSIFKKTGLTADFARNGSSYFALEGGTLTVFGDGETKTY